MGSWNTIPVSKVCNIKSSNCFLYLPIHRGIASTPEKHGNRNNYFAIVARFAICSRFSEPPPGRAVLSELVRHAKQLSCCILTYFLLIMQMNDCSGTVPTNGVPSTSTTPSEDAQKRQVPFFIISWKLTLARSGH